MLICGCARLHPQAAPRVGPRFHFYSQDPPEAGAASHSSSTTRPRTRLTPAVAIRAANVSGNVRMSSIGRLSRFAGRVSMSGGRRAVMRYASFDGGSRPDGRAASAGTPNGEAREAVSVICGRLKVIWLRTPIGRGKRVPPYTGRSRCGPVRLTPTQ